MRVANETWAKSARRLIHYPALIDPSISIRPSWRIIKSCLLKTRDEPEAIVTLDVDFELLEVKHTISRAN